MATAARIHGTHGPDRLQAVNGVRDLVSCGRGHDLATVDGLDRVARDCEVVTRQASRDPYENGESQHETEVEPDSAAFGKTVVAVFQVGRIFDGGARSIGYAVSRDSGRTWRRGFLPGLTPRASDPIDRLRPPAQRLARGLARLRRRRLEARGQPLDRHDVTGARR